jgi:hypothetical protein
MGHFMIGIGRLAELKEAGGGDEGRISCQLLVVSLANGMGLVLLTTDN